MIGIVMGTYRAAVIGLGRMGSTFDDEIEQGGSIVLPYCHAPTYDAHPQIDLIAGADPHDEQRTIFGERWGIPSDHLYSDHRELLAQEKPDIVSIATTARIRAQILLDIVASGVKGIWAEKPLALSLEDADKMVQACNEKGVALAVNCARRYHSSFAETRRMIEDGELGDILQITAYTQCGLSHNGSHAIDTIRYLAGGDVTWVFGEMESDEKAATDDDLMGNGYLVFDNGVRAFMRGMPTGVAAWEFDIIGTKKRVRTSPNALEFELLQNVPGGPRGRGLSARSPFPQPARPEGMGITIVNDLISAIENNHPPRCSGEDALKALEIAIALRESHRQGGKRINLPIADRSLKILSSEIHADHTPARVRRSQNT
ncbi:MAG: putative dehydrogenase [Candidatus Latescibacterota bacterium]|jgi:predicted dehydrogenase